LFSPNADRSAASAATKSSTGSKQAILAPLSAIVMRGSLACVYALDGSGVAQLRYVTLGPRHGDAVEILSGLAAGERLVDNPADRDLAGKRIEVQP
jgi:multidrug efflux pump subunit AcrA (membrane-fusion protein)